MFEAVEEKKLGVQPIRFAYACVVIFAAGAIRLQIREYGWKLVLSIGMPVAILALALFWLNMAEGEPTRRLGNRLIVLLGIASIGTIIRVIFFP